MLKKLLAVLIAIVMLFGTTSMVAAVDTTAKTLPAYSINGGSFDLGIANDARLIKMLKKQGVIGENASPAQAEAALTQYLKAKAATSQKQVGELDKLESKVESLIAQKQYTKGTYNGNGKKFGQTKGSVAPVQEEAWNGAATTDKILVVLIDYPDNPNSSITADETDMFYDNYPREHYQQMLFGQNGYIGPTGENLMSMKQYYAQQSGGSYKVDGQVAGWYTAKYPAKYYGENVPAPDGDDANARALTKEALLAVSKDTSIDISQYDQEDRYDLDGDGNYRESDGLIDHLMIIHAGVGEEAGGGALGADAIWSHSWNLGAVTTIPGTSTGLPYWGGKLAAYNYTIQPEDGAPGVFCHEYGHDLGLKDEYDTIYSGRGEAIAYWSIMASGSWAGKIGGAEPTGFSPYAKQYFQAKFDGNWQTGTRISLDEITGQGIEVVLDQASTKGTNNDALRIDLPMKEKIVNTPVTGDYEYFSGSANNLDNSMTTTLDLTKASTAKLTFKAWYQIEEDWDYASIKVNGQSIPGNITTTSDPYEQNPGHGITGNSNGWIDAEFDLSAYAGQSIQLEINYWTDVASVEPGFYVDDIQVIADGAVVLSDGAEGDSLFTLNGFEKNTGKLYFEHYYLVEWRNHHGVDMGLKDIARGVTLMQYDPGMVIWYMDSSYDNNWVGKHPGDGYLGIVDADQHVLDWSDKATASTRYQMHDAAFGLAKPDDMYLDYPGTFTMKDNYSKAITLFDDSNVFIDAKIPDAGRNIPSYGLKIRVTGESSDRSVGKILIFK